VLCGIDDRGVATVTLNRPAVNNAYNDALIDGLNQTFCRLERSAPLRCVILCGAGRHFQAGADLAFLQHLRTVSSADNLDFHGGPWPRSNACGIFLARMSPSSMAAVSAVAWGLPRPATLRLLPKTRSLH
jgi:enoyl-CoA hydratase/carnithine racemase